MGGHESKIEKPNANVINNLEIIDHTDQLNSIRYLLLAITVISIADLSIRIYQLHKKSLRKRYLSRANELDKI